MVAVFAIPSIVRIAHDRHLYDVPNGRTIHQSPTPRLGGAAIFVGFLSALTVFGDLRNGVQQLLAGCVVLFSIGLKDDIITVSAFKKFFVQILATGIVVFQADIRITSFQGFMGIYALETGFSYAFTLLVVVGLTNAVNLIDGIDGLAGSVTLLISATFGTFFYLYGGETYGAYANVAFCLVGALLGFLRYNLHRATIFMGDAGSLLVGFTLSVMAIQFVEMRPIHSAPTIAVGTLILPILDTLRVLIIRILKGISPFSPDKNHIHHTVMRLGFTQLQTVGILVAINSSVIAFTVFFADWGNNVQFIILLLFSFLFSLALEGARSQAVTKIDA
ncbi:MAG: undecaprenyl/decaprenyl-phosphate alpha-N-acetylglucosaminyl 1-phosphate transferase [Ferruginibacter sp.]|nr:undecaprenyl/decaprenyl-phosphate alpha-N-acetylglucosaminyl 1-phosphate transferase [Cytophagales bacterium]